MTPRRLAIYRSADDAAAAVAAGAQLVCPTGCGVCCVRIPPHVSVADMAPVARAVVAAGEGEALLERARRTGAGPCVLFAPGQLSGGCTVYALRPMTCRLFAFAAVRDKHGALELAVCREHAAGDPDAGARARAYVAEHAAPVFAAYQLDAHDPEDGPAELVPINDALVAALERELLRAQYR